MSLFYVYVWVLYELFFSSVILCACFLCKHVRLSCVGLLYKKTYLLTYLTKLNSTQLTVRVAGKEQVGQQSFAVWGPRANSGDDVIGEGASSQRVWTALWAPPAAAQLFSCTLRSPGRLFWYVLRETSAQVPQSGSNPSWARNYMSKRGYHQWQWHQPPLNCSLVQFSSVGRFWSSLVIALVSETSVPGCDIAVNIKEESQFSCTVFCCKVFAGFWILT